MENIIKKWENIEHYERQDLLMNIIGYEKLKEYVPFRKEEIQKAIVSDIYLNNLSLGAWDSMSHRLTHLIAKAKKEVDPNYKGGASLSDGVSLLKYVARKIIEE